MSTHRPLQAEIHQRDLEFGPVEGNPRQLLESDSGLAWLEVGRNPLGGTQRLLQLARPHLARLLDAVVASQDTQAIVYAPLGMARCQLAQAQQLPSILAALVPLTPTRAFPPPAPHAAAGAAPTTRPPTWSPSSWAGSRSAASSTTGDTRPRLGAGRAARSGRYQQRQPVLYGYSPSVLPRPPDWGSHLHVTGYWFPDPEPAWQPPPAPTRPYRPGAAVFGHHIQLEDGVICAVRAVHHHLALPREAPETT